MDIIQSLINKLALAANAGEDNIALLEMVEEIKGVLIAQHSKQPPDTTLASSSVSVVLPQGFRIKTASATSKQREFDESKLSAPKPPSVVTQIIEKEVPAEPLLFSEPLEEQITPNFSHPEAISTPEFSITSSIVGHEEEKAENRVFPELRSPWMPADQIEDALELPITDEMVHEAVALENQTMQPIPEAMQDHPLEMPVIEEKSEPQDLNQKLAQRSKVLNEVFTNKVPVLAETLSEPRISDLRKAISINEKYQYIDSLFRGDEMMFERSIKTLNNFDILPEAQYWMQRELLIKLGWNDEDELVQRFFSLVSRRFS